MTPGTPSAIEIHPLTPERWDDFESLFSARGGCGGCWCMWWRLTRAQFGQQKGEGNRQAMRSIVLSGQVPGLLAYVDAAPAGWCAVAPRDTLPLLNRSRILKKIDETPVWSVVCFFVGRRFRNRGLSLHLLKSAVEYVRSQGATVVEGYPVEPRGGRAPDPFVYTGLVSTFRRAGFVECARRSETRPIMRYYLQE
jgi:GNAT superfamily N-acetyltransferase